MKRRSRERALRLSTDHPTRVELNFGGAIYEMDVFVSKLTTGAARMADITSVCDNYETFAILGPPSVEIELRGTAVTRKAA